MVDAHHLGNLIRLCRPYHFKAGSLDTRVTPDFTQIPHAKTSDFHRLWKKLHEDSGEFDSW